MITYFLGFISWQTWIIVIFIILFILWVFHGGKEYRMIGLDPLDPRKDLKQTLGSEEYNKKKAELHPRKSDNRPEGRSEPERSPDGSLVEVDKVVRKLRKNASDDMDISIDMTPEIPKELLDKKLEKKQKRRRHTSKKEELCRQIIEEIYGKPFPPIRPSWLINPETGYPLELDCYNDELKLAIEYNGEQHYQFPNFTGQTKEAFIAQIRRDKFKIDKCDQIGVYLITVPYTVPDHLVKDYITYYLPESCVAREKEKNDMLNA